MSLPVVQIGVFNSLLTEIDVRATQHDPNWPDTMFTRLRESNPVLAEYLATTRQNDGEIPALVGLVVYRILEAQAEVDQLETMFGE